MTNRKELIIKFVKLNPNAAMPKHAHEFGDAGFDISAVEDTVLAPAK